MKASILRILSSSSSHFLQMIGMVMIGMNVLTAFAGMQHQQSPPDNQEYYSMPSSLSSSISSLHRNLQSKSIDYSSCYMDLSFSDENKNGFIEQQEYYAFLQAYGKRVCYKDTSTITLQQKSTFYTLACLCKQMDGNGSLNDETVIQSDQCCLGANAKLYTARDPITLLPTPVPALSVSQKEYFKTICFYADASIPASERDCAATATADGGEDFPLDDVDDGSDTTNTTMNGSEEYDEDDEYSSEMENQEEEDEEDVEEPKGTAACRFTSMNLLDDGSLVLRHYSDPIEESITIQLIYNGIGWLGFAFTNPDKEAKMIHNSGVLGLPNIRKVQQFDLAGRSITGVTPTPIQSLLRSSITQNGDQTVLTFTQSASEIGMDIYNGTFQFIYAVGRENELAYHTQRGSMRTQYAQCDVILPPSSTVVTSPTVSMKASLPPVTAPISTSASTTRSPKTVSTSQIPSSTPTSYPKLSSQGTAITAPTAPVVVVPVSSPTKQPQLRGVAPSSSSGSNEDDDVIDDDTSDSVTLVEEEGNGNKGKGGKTAKELIEDFLNGGKNNSNDDDEESLSSSPPTTTAETKDNENDNDLAGMSSFIRWLRVIWLFSKKPFIEAD